MHLLRLTPHFYYTPEVTPRWEVHMNQIGGMQIQIFRLARALSERGVEQTILPIGMTCAPKSWEVDERTHVHRANLPMLPIRSRRWGSLGLYAFWALGAAKWITWHELSRRITGGGADYDQVHVHCSGVASPLVLGLYAKLLLGKPLVYTVHCCRASTYTPIDQLDRITNSWIRWIERHCLSRADTVVVLTERTRKLVLEQYPEFDPANVVVISDMVDPDAFASQATPEKAAAFASDFSLPAGKRLVTFVGRLDPDKGWRYFIQALPKVPNPGAHFLVCGDGNERGDLERMIDALGLRDRVTVTGFIANDKVAVGMHLSEMIVVPSLYEELGSIMLEAASLKKPIIASDVGGIPAIIRDGESGLLVPSRSPERIAEKIEQLLADPQLGRRLGRAAYQHVQTSYGESMTVEKLVREVYQRTGEENESPLRRQLPADAPTAARVAFRAAAPVDVGVQPLRLPRPPGADRPRPD